MITGITVYNCSKCKINVFKNQAHICLNQKYTDFNTMLANNQQINQKSLEVRLELLEERVKKLEDNK